MLGLSNSLTCCCLCFVARTPQGFCISSTHSKRLTRGEMYFPHAYNKDSFTKYCVHNHAHTHRVHGPPCGLKSSSPTSLSTQKAWQIFQHQVLMAVLRNHLYFNSDRGIRGSKASPSHGWCLAVGLTEPDSFRLGAEVNPKSAPVGVLGDYGVPAHLWGREEKGCWRCKTFQLRHFIPPSLGLPASISFPLLFSLLSWRVFDTELPVSTHGNLGKGEVVGGMEFLQFLVWADAAPEPRPEHSCRGKVLLVDLYPCELYSNHFSCINPLPHWWMTSTIPTCVKKITCDSANLNKL